jgi:hypothetical protein
MVCFGDHAFKIKMIKPAKTHQLLHNGICDLILRTHFPQNGSFMGGSTLTNEMARRIYSYHFLSILRILPIFPLLLSQPLQAICDGLERWLDCLHLHQNLTDLEWMNKTSTNVCSLHHVFGSMWQVCVNQSIDVFSTRYGYTR